eukprot:CAMPEP_0113554070 /NCGR_PEP_ID=MMETSP0015_2-20120614/15949_1 /TAXON_ID=2838 /ORGANISM="Odontella" /LENGTH=517 /DNA_ID=CAMNT_0000455179 /DNA_START=29 /DNA_END=1582 /DNA_ORIENTATION=+ /assembly_acc=CAM_ASM_000160
MSSKRTQPPLKSGINKSSSSPPSPGSGARLRQGVGLRDNDELLPRIKGGDTDRRPSALTKDDEGANESSIFNQGDKEGGGVDTKNTAEAEARRSSGRCAPPSSVDAGDSVSVPPSSSMSVERGGDIPSSIQSPPMSPTAARRKGRSDTDVRGLADDPASKRTRRASSGGRGSAGASSAVKPASSSASPLPSPASAATDPPPQRKKVMRSLPSRPRPFSSSAGGVFDAETALSVLFPDRNVDNSGGGASRGNRQTGGVGDESEEVGEGEDDDEREFMTKSCDVWVKFRAGHGGDASALASLCRLTSSAVGNGVRDGSAPSEDPSYGPPDGSDNSNPPQSEQRGCERSGIKGECDEAGAAAAVGGDSDDVTNLELRLASGFGDEQTPPAFHAILAEVHDYRGCGQGDQYAPSSTRRCRNLSIAESEENNDTQSIRQEGTAAAASTASESAAVRKFLGGAAISTLEWDADTSCRVLRVELLRLDERRCKEYRDLLRRRLVLRLSAFALATGCAAMRMPVP